MFRFVSRAAPACLIITLACGSSDDELANARPDAQVGQPDGAPAQPDAAPLPDATVALPDASMPQPDATALPDAGSLPDVGGPDATQPDASMGQPDAGANPSDICGDLGLDTIPFQAGTGGTDFGDVAGDFTVNLLGGGTWNFQQNYSGCESYIFVNYIPTQAGQFESIFWGSDFAKLLDTIPDNAHYFFTSLETTSAARTARVQNMSTRVNLLLDARYRNDPQGRAKQARRFYFVTDQTTMISGSVGAFVNSYLNYLPSSAVEIGAGRSPQPARIPWILGIDRDQRFEAGGDVTSWATGEPELRIAGYAPNFYNHLAAMKEKVASEPATQVRTLLKATVTDRVFTSSVALPDALAMAAFDTMEVDVSVHCGERNHFACSEWDRIARIEVCPSGSCSCPPDTPECSNGDLRRELVRWITPYWRRGTRRWIMDASSLLPLVKDGGVQAFRIEMGPSWERKTSRDVDISIRLSNQSKSLKPTGAVLAFRGGRFGADYNDREPFKFTPPATAQRVELVTILSGHGDDRGETAAQCTQDSECPSRNCQGNGTCAFTACAEWCDHRHEFTIGSTVVADLRHTGPRIFNGLGCADQAINGLPPGQGGNWPIQRAFWCPGLPVEHGRTDITSDVVLGQENELTYEGNFAGLPPPGNFANISLSTYVVWYE